MQESNESNAALDMAEVRKRNFPPTRILFGFSVYYQKDIRLVVEAHSRVTAQVTEYERTVKDQAEAMFNWGEVWANRDGLDTTLDDRWTRLPERPDNPVPETSWEFVSVEINDRRPAGYLVELGVREVNTYGNHAAVYFWLTVDTASVAASVVTAIMAVGVNAALRPPSGLTGWKRAPGMGPGAKSK